jgi:hypothetical protein
VFLNILNRYDYRRSSRLAERHMRNAAGVRAGLSKLGRVHQESEAEMKLFILTVSSIFVLASISCAGELKTVIVIDTPVVPSDGQAREFHWKNPTGRTIYIKGVHIYAGANNNAPLTYPVGNITYLGYLYRESDQSILFYCQWGVGVNNTPPFRDFGPDNYRLDSGDTLTLATSSVSRDGNPDTVQSVVLVNYTY